MNELDITNMRKSQLIVVEAVVLPFVIGSNFALNCHIR